MRRVAVIGSGLAGLLTAHGLLKGGCQVTLFTDRTPEQWLHESSPSGTALRFESSFAFERELGLHYWEDLVPWCRSIEFRFCARPGERPVRRFAQFENGQRAQAIDLRLQSHRWMKDLEMRGGELVLEAVGIDSLDEIAAAYDLAIVAAGRSELSRIFPRDDARSTFDKPQRNLAMVIVKGPAMDLQGTSSLAVKCNCITGLGEVGWVPYYHRDVGPCWNLVFEAVPGGPLDRFQGVRSGAEAVEIARSMIRDFNSWDAAWAGGMELADEHGWLVGGFTPVVKKPVGRLPSGRIVTGVGDTLVLLDPVSGGGANSGSAMARNLVESILARGDGPLDAMWMAETFEKYWEQHGRQATFRHNLYLRPPTLADTLFAAFRTG